MTLSTQGSDGPWAAAVFYVENGDSLVFLSSPNSRHGRNLAQDPRCAATIHSETDDWNCIQGIQIEGSVSELDGEERAHAQQRYGERFPFARPIGAPPAIVLALLRVRWYRLVIVRLYFVDNQRGLGHRQEFEGVRKTGGTF
jgi:uncharacterized protein YhbP (UPF0306 family)